MKSLAKAILAVMSEVKGIDKTMTIGSGANSYKGVPDQEVKKIIGESMQRNGLCLLPVSIKSNIKIERWEENSQYGVKQKQSVFTDATTEYLLLHESGESQVVCGYGHGVDSQDKAAGKATTYALKYLLLYLFLVPTGKIDDSDNSHSDEKEIPKNVVKVPIKPAKVIKKVDLLPGTPKWQDAIVFLKTGTIEQVEKAYILSASNRELLISESV